MPARVCWDTTVAPRGRVGQMGASVVSGRWPVASVRRPYECLGHNPAGGRVSVPRGRSLAWARVARMCVCFKRVGEISGLLRAWGGLVGRNGCRRDEEVRRAWGWMGHGRERVARESDAFFGVPGANGVGCGQGGAADVGVGASGAHWLKQYGERKAMAVGSELGAGGLAVRKGDGFGRT